MRTKFKSVVALCLPKPFHFNFLFGRTFVRAEVLPLGAYSDISDDARVNLVTSISLGRTTFQLKDLYCFGISLFISTIWCSR
jgi:hypothetical protein